MIDFSQRRLLCAFILAFIPGGSQAFADENGKTPALFAKDNLVAWCIVPFDAAKRGPQERAEMLKRLGIAKAAYDWRQQHVPMFEEEIEAYKRHGLEFFAFWSWHPDFARLVKKHGIKPQFGYDGPIGILDHRPEVDAGKSLRENLRGLKELSAELKIVGGLEGAWLFSDAAAHYIARASRILPERHDTNLGDI